jgi:polysaccharide biosynthesis protein PelD
MQQTHDHGPEQQPRRLLGVRVSALLEISALLALALATDALLLDASRFAEVRPHPFWAIVLLAAAQYGTNEGLLAAALATVALLAGRVPEQGFDEDPYAWLLRISVTPVLWLIAAVVLGGIRDGHKRRSDALREELARTRGEARAIAEAYERLFLTKSELEARVAGQVRTVPRIYNAARAIERKDTCEVLMGVAPLMRSVLGPTKFSLFLLNGRTLEAAASAGWTSEDRFVREFDSDTELFRAVVGGRQTLVGANPEHEAILRGEGMLAGPLVSEETGKVIGMLKVEEIPFVELNPSTVQNFRVACDWVGQAFDNAQSFARLQEEQGPAPMAAWG